VGDGGLAAGHGLAAAPGFGDEIGLREKLLLVPFFPCPHMKSRAFLVVCCIKLTGCHMLTNRICLTILVLLA
jgi:hypothetical protein